MTVIAAIKTPATTTAIITTAIVSSHRSADLLAAITAVEEKHRKSTTAEVRVLEHHMIGNIKRKLMKKSQNESLNERERAYVGVAGKDYSEFECRS